MKCPHCHKDFLPPAVKLHDRPSELLKFISEFQKANDYTPSFQEMTDALGLMSKSSIDRILKKLEELGKIRHLHNRARAIEIMA